MKKNKFRLLACSMFLAAAGFTSCVSSDIPVVDVPSKDDPVYAIPEDYAGTPFFGEPTVLPGQIDCIFFDKGGRGVAFDWNDGVGGGDRPDGEGDVNFVWGFVQLGWLNGSDQNWAKYTVHVEKTGDYDFKSNGVNFRFTFGEDSDAQETAQTFWEKIHVKAGDYVLKVWYPSGADAVSIVVKEWEAPKSPEQKTAEYKGVPFNDKPFDIPGSIPCEQFDKGGNGVAYEWMPGAADFRDDASFAYVGGIGWTAPNQYVVYTVNVEKEGFYRLTSKCHGTDGAAAIRLLVDYADQGGTYSCFTGGRADNAWLDRTFDNVWLPAGKHLLALVCASGGFDIQSITFDYLGEVPTAAEPTPFGGTAAEIPGKIEFENFDDGPLGVAYNWQTLYATADTYRDQIYFIGSGAHGYHVGWNDGAEDDWLRYTVSVTEAGEYAIRVSAATGYDDGSQSGFAFEFDGVKGEKFFYGENNGWDAYKAYDLPESYNVRLEAGEHVLKVYLYHTNANFVRFTKVDD